MKTIFVVFAFAIVSLLTMSCNMKKSMPDKDETIQREEEYRDEDMRENDSFERTVPVDEGDPISQ